MSYDIDDNTDDSSDGNNPDVDYSNVNDFVEHGELVMIINQSVMMIFISVIIVGAL